MFDQEWRQSFQIVIQERMQQTLQGKEYGIANVPTDEKPERFWPMIVKLCGDAMIYVVGGTMRRRQMRNGSCGNTSATSEFLYDESGPAARIDNCKGCYHGERNDHHKNQRQEGTKCVRSLTEQSPIAFSSFSVSRSSSWHSSRRGRMMSGRRPGALVFV